MPLTAAQRQQAYTELMLDDPRWIVLLVPWNPSSFALGVVQVRASQGRRGRDTGSYVDRGERREVRAWAARSVKRLGFHGTSDLRDPGTRDAPAAAPLRGSAARIGPNAASATSKNQSGGPAKPVSFHADQVQVHGIDRVRLAIGGLR